MTVDFYIHRHALGTCHWARGSGTHTQLQPLVTRSDQQRVNVHTITKYTFITCIYIIVYIIDLSVCMCVCEIKSAVFTIIIQYRQIVVAARGWRWVEVARGNDEGVCESSSGHDFPRTLRRRKNSWGSGYTVRACIHTHKCTRTSTRTQPPFSGHCVRSPPPPPTVTRQNHPTNLIPRLYVLRVHVYINTHTRACPR
jgi:hypothetical protein